MTQQVFYLLFAIVGALVVYGVIRKGSVSTYRYHLARSDRPFRYWSWIALMSIFIVMAALAGLGIIGKPISH